MIEGMIINWLIYIILLENLTDCWSINRHENRNGGSKGEGEWQEVIETGDDLVPQGTQST